MPTSATLALTGSNGRISDFNHVPIKEAATLLDVSTDTIRRMLKDGRLTGEMVDGIWMVDVSQQAASFGAGDKNLPVRLIVDVLERELERRAIEIERLTSMLASAQLPWYRKIFR